MLPAVFIISARVIRQGFGDLETSDARDHVQQAVSVLDSEVAEIYSKTVSWSASDDVYNFIAGQNPGYLNSRIFPATVLNLRVNLIAFYDSQGTALAVKGYNLANGLEGPVSADVLAAFEENRSKLISADTNQGISGIILAGNHAMLVASHPVTPSNPGALSNGILVFARYLDDNEIQRLAKSSNQLIDVRLLEDENLPADFRTARDMLDRDSIIVNPLNDTTLAGYTLLDDLQGTSRWILKVQVLRVIHQRSQNTQRIFLLSLLVLGLAFGIIGQTTLERMMISQRSGLETMGRYRAVVEQISEGMIQIDAVSKNILEANASFAALLGYDPLALIGKSLFEIGIQEQADLEMDLNRMVAAPQAILGERRYCRKDGSSLDVEVSSARIEYNGHQVLCIVIRDVTSRKQAEKALLESRERYQLAARGANDGLWDWDLKTNELYLSSRWKSMLGYREDQVQNTPEAWFDLVHPDDLPELKVQLEAHLHGSSSHFQNEHRIRHSNGEYRWMLSRGLAVFDETGNPYRIAGSQTDITERKLSEEQYRYDAMHDALTCLPNRSLFLDRLAQAIERAKRRPDYLFALLFLDFDRFKVINDSLGHSVGDMLLVSGARRLEGCLRAMDTIARLGGDEFVILIEYLDSPDSAIRVAERIQEALAPPFTLSGHEIFTSASIGIVLSSIGYEHAEDALRDADIAMYRSKALGRARYVVFEPGLRSMAVTRLERETDLRRAIERNEFLIHYQPILSLATGQITGFEALIRWQHPTLGMIPPSEFIPVAEETGLIIPIGHWVLREACQQMTIWQTLYPEYRNLTISVNMSGKQFSQPNLPEDLARILEETGLDINCLRLEITESVVMEAIEFTTNMLKRLKQMGIQLEIDDFGTGYSSLSYLQQLPIDAIKIDRSFISQMNLGANNQGIVQAIVSLAHNLGMHVIAEGVEASDQLDRLKSMDCELGQGFLFHRPMTGEAVIKLLEGIAGVT